ncbi:hypothetical protein [Butyrivibrio sp. INlla14]|uniref:hypothetical protein n=1 Tax=Butyrivibrio sp. INlla14 TaxID=1520808 RepID=UPI000875FC9A|nr:hypothetical protein [Butyrivibrio sp. INlla14]SCY17011.1 hypothetical protein SAMN02910371_01326 [Butyrivibrio sp. INlla14]
MTDIKHINIEIIDPDEIETDDPAAAHNLPRIDSMMEWGVVKAGDVLVAKDRTDEAELLANGNVKCPEGEKTMGYSVR